MCRYRSKFANSSVYVACFSRLEDSSYSPVNLRRYFEIIHNENKDRSLLCDHFVFVRHRRGVRSSTIEQRVGRVSTMPSTMKSTDSFAGARNSLVPRKGKKKLVVQEPD